MFPLRWLSAVPKPGGASLWMVSFVRSINSSRKLLFDEWNNSLSKYVECEWGEKVQGRQRGEEKEDVYMLWVKNLPEDCLQSSVCRALLTCTYNMCELCLWDEKHTVILEFVANTVQHRKGFGFFSSQNTLKFKKHKWFVFTNPLGGKDGQKHPVAVVSQPLAWSSKVKTKLYWNCIKIV